METPCHVSCGAECSATISARSSLGSAGSTRFAWGAGRTDSAANFPRSEIAGVSGGELGAADAVGVAVESGSVPNGDKVAFLGSAGCPGAGVLAGFRLSQNAPHCSFSLGRGWAFVVSSASTRPSRSSGNFDVADLGDADSAAGVAARNGKPSAPDAAP